MTSEKPRKIFILALDGTPYSLLKRLISYGMMPHLQQLTKQYHFREMTSVLPTVSSVAWASFLTGRSPAEHGIFGFIERDPRTMEVYIPTATHMAGKTLPEVLSERGRRVFSMNIPISYPPRQVNGIEISGFLCPDLAKGTWPPPIAAELMDMDYRIDVDTVRAREDLEHFAAELLFAYEKRVQAMWKYRQREDWDLFLVHIMETDRLHHFMWEFMETQHPRWSGFFMDFYRGIDTLIGQVAGSLKADEELVVLSDHGFTTLKKEVYINKWLFDNGYLRYKSDNPPDELFDIHPQSRAYSLIPGRIYINLSGREKDGIVQPGLEYDRLCLELSQALQDLKDPQSGELMVRKVWMAGEITLPNPLPARLQGGVSSGSETGWVVPDLLIEPESGYDFKGNLWYPQLTEKGPINGTHTLDDAFILSTSPLPQGDMGIVDCFDWVMGIMG